MSDTIKYLIDIAAAQPFSIKLMLLFIALVLAIALAATALTTMIKTAATTIKEATTATQWLAIIISQRVRLIAVLLLIISVLLLALEVSLPGAPTRASCLAMILTGGFSFLMFAYLAVDIFFVIAARRMERERKPKP